MVDFVRERRAHRSVNLTPLIDVVFLLIVFFMLSTSFVMSESFELSLPGDKALNTPLPDVMRLYVMPDGDVAIDRERYDMGQLNQQMRATLEQKPDQKILILSSKGVNVQSLVEVMDIVYLNGGRNVQIDEVK